jgi:hypothetical protein
VTTRRWRPSNCRQAGPPQPGQSCIGVSCRGPRRLGCKEDRPCSDNCRVRHPAHSAHQALAWRPRQDAGSPLKSGHRSARCNVRFGSLADIGTAPRNVCFTPERGHSVRGPRCPLSANSGHHHCQSGQSITLSASAISFGGISSPSTFAVLRLITSSNFVGCSIGKSAGLAPFNILSTKIAAF